MAKVSVIIPSRNEPYLPQTLRDIYAGAAGDIEVIVVLDGEKQPEYNLPEYKGLRLLHNPEVKGLRWCVNHAVDVAKGKFIMKIDAHCTIGEGWDEILKADCDDNWMVVPRRYFWDAPKWDYCYNKDGSISCVDAHYYFYPYLRPYSPRLTTRPWPERAEARKHILVDEDMGMQGSLWFMQKSLFHRLGGFNQYGYGTFSSEPEELNLKLQLGPLEGKVMRNKKTWYAHWQKPAAQWWNRPAAEVGRVSDLERTAGNWYCFIYWFRNQWAERVHDFEWLVDKFWPVPTWPDNWRQIISKHDRYDVDELYGYLLEVNK
jgi:glycosyltransferase involved in cell wall biosynthesis